jgi:hypothetical protein
MKGKDNKLAASAGMISLSLNNKAGGNLTSLVENNFKVGDLAMCKRNPIYGLSSPSTEDNEGLTVNYWCFDCCTSGRDGRSFHWYDSTSPQQPGFIRCTKFVKSGQGCYL